MVQLVTMLLILLPISASALYGGSKIVNSQSAEIRDLYRHTVRLIVTEKDGSRSHCTGTIVGVSKIIAAAHCLDNAHSIAAKFYDQAEQEVAVIYAKNYEPLGDGMIAKDLGVKIVDQKIQIVRWTHPHTSDLGFIYLTHNIPSGYIPVEVNLNYTDEDLHSRELFKIGFGRSQYDRKIGKFRYAYLYQGFLIGLGQGSEGIMCSGDSGGGVIYFEHGKPVLIGVISSGAAIAPDGTISRPPCNGLQQMEFVSGVGSHKEWVGQRLER